MSHIMYVGGVGMGKTALAVFACQKDVGDNIFSNIPLNEDFFPVPGEPGKLKNIIEWTSLDELEHAHCGVWLMDEADMWLDSRKFSTLNDVARRKLKEHRKDDIRIISTTQHVSFVDRVFRILCDEVRVVKRSSLPFLGWFVPSAIRPTMLCAHCGRCRPDGVGDDSHWLKRLLGFATIYMWDVYPASILGADESANAQDARADEDEETGKTHRIGGGWKLFNMDFIGGYDTSCKTSQRAGEALKMAQEKNLRLENEARETKAAAAAKRKAEKKAPPPDAPELGDNP